MLRVTALNIVVNTTDGLYGFKCEFGPHLNIVRGDNSSGKSTLFQTILYGIGMEELIGSRNDKAMQSVLKNEILDNDGIKRADVIESFVQLELWNSKQRITTERYVRSETKDSRLLKVYYGGILTGDDQQVKSDLMYVHDAGAATDTQFGFFAFFESFLGYQLPELQYNDGAIRKLYLQTIFPSFIIEQKVGWSDFLATTPFFNLRDKEKRAIEFVLKLDSWNIERRKQELAQIKQDINATWSAIYARMNEIARRSATEIKGVGGDPSILNDKEKLFLSYNLNETEYSIASYLTLLTKQLIDLEAKEIPKISEISKLKEAELQETTDAYNSLQLHETELSNRRTTIQGSVLTIEERLSQIEEELTHNKHHLKVKNLASEKALLVAKEQCPTCGQDIGDSLLNRNTVQIPMTIDQNIGYLEAQKSMIKNYLDNHRKEMTAIDLQLNRIGERISDARDKIRAIKKDLISDERLPSIQLLEERIKLRNRVEFYKGIEETFRNLIDAIFKVSQEWSQLLVDQEKLPKESFSTDDFKKLKFFNTSFLNMLKAFGYGSKSLADLSISKERLIPVAEGQYSIKYNMRLDSSASDLVRAIAAYTFSLYKVSTEFDTNHPSLIMLDEPGTQETAIASLKQMLTELQSYQAQSIIFASFKQSDADFNETTSGLKFKLISSTGKFIKKIKSL